jgi:hypothetical protein
LRTCLCVEPDGCLGRLTIAAANQRDGEELAAAFREAGMKKYQELVKSCPHYARYLDTWIGRC